MDHSPAPTRPATVRGGPLPRTTAWRGVAHCVAISAGMLGRGEVRWPRDHVGRLVHFEDGTSGRVYRETAVTHRVFAPCVLVVTFRLRAVHGQGHEWFRRESLVNTPLFVGFPGFVSKLWLAHDERDRYRGLYDWDGPGLAEHYARSLWRVLDLVSVPGSVDYRVLPDVRRDELLQVQVPAARGPGDGTGWWRPVGTT